MHMVVCFVCLGLGFFLHAQIARDYVYYKTYDTLNPKNLDTETVPKSRELTEN